jgi:TATA-box binding protein (TBP) (component of TFIID and TFIIIB)
MPVDILTTLKHPRYKPPTNRFKGGILRLTHATCLFFTSGKVVINGCKAIDSCSKTVWECAEEFGILISSCMMVNVVGDFKAGVGLDLERVAQVTGGVFEPLLHPGASYHINKVSVLIYHNGAGVFCGCKTMEQFSHVCGCILDVINTCAKNIE